MYGVIVVCFDVLCCFFLSGFFSGFFRDFPKKAESSGLPENSASQDRRVSPISKICG